MINTATIDTMACPDWCMADVHIDDSDHVGEVTQLPAFAASHRFSVAPSMTAEGDTVILVGVDDSEATMTPGQTRAYIAALQNVLDRVTA